MTEDAEPNHVSEAFQQLDIGENKKQIEKECKGQGEICLIGDCFKKKKILIGKATCLSKSGKSKEDSLKCFQNVIAICPEV